MYFFLEKHTYKNDGFIPTDFQIIQTNNLNKIKKHLININRKAKSIKTYYYSPYHVFDYLDINDINHVYRYGKMTKNEVDNTLEEFDDLKVITL